MFPGKATVGPLKTHEVADSNHRLPPALSGQRSEDLVVEVVERASIVRFWHNPHAQDGLRRQMIHKLDNRDDLFPFDEQAALADKLMELAKANRALISSRTSEARRT